jgi:hypothetical protein
MLAFSRVSTWWQRLPAFKKLALAALGVLIPLFLPVLLDKAWDYYIVLPREMKNQQELAVLRQREIDAERALIESLEKHTRALESDQFLGTVEIVLLPQMTEGKSGEAIESLVVNSGISKRFTYRAYTESGNLLDTEHGLTYSWSLNDAYKSSDLGEITPDGLYTPGHTDGFYSGAIQLKACWNGQSVLKTVSVDISATPSDLEIAVLYIDPKQIALLPGQSYRFQSHASTSDWHSAEVEVQWRVRYPEIGTIDQDGVFIASNLKGTFNSAVEVTHGSLVAYSDVIIVGKTKGSFNTVISPTETTVVSGNSKTFNAQFYQGIYRVIPDNITWFVDGSKVGSGNDMTELNIETQLYSLGVHTVSVRGVKDQVASESKGTIIIRSAENTTNRP